MSDEPQKVDAPAEQELIKLREGIEQTRSDMSGTLRALEEKLNPADLRDKAAEELGHVEEHVKAAVREQLHEVRGIVKEELKDAKDSLTELMVTAKDTVIKDAKNAVGELMVTAKDTVIKDAKEAAGEIIIKAKDAVKDDVLAIKDSVKRDVSDAFTHAKTAARAATLGKLEDFATEAGDAMTTARDTLVDTVRQNPIPAALAGIGIVWLLMNRSRNTPKRGSGAYEYSYPNSRDPGLLSGAQSAVSHALSSAGQAASHAQHSLSELAHDAQAKAATFAHGASDAAGNALNTVSTTAKNTLSSATEGASHLADGAAQLGGSLVHSAGGLAHQAGDSVSHLAHQAGDSVSQLAQGIPRQARRVEQQAERTFLDNPLAVGAAVLAVGAVVGLSLPRSRREDQLMGGTRDRLIQGAQGAAHDAAIAVRHLGEEAASAINGGLSSTHHS